MHYPKEINANCIISIFAGIILDLRSNDSLKEEDTKMLSLSLNLTHLEHWERHHGRIPHGSFVILRSGWADYYQFHDKFFGYFSGEVKQMFPGKNVKILFSYFLSGQN